MRPLRATAWERRFHDLERVVVDELVAVCRNFHPELATWSDQALTNAYAHYYLECISDEVQPPTSRMPHLLLYLYLLEYQVPDAFGVYYSKAEPLEETALREIESLWLGEPL
jgi:hypothetical protein